MTDHSDNSHHNIEPTPGGPMDGALEGGIPMLFTGPEIVKSANRGLDEARSQMKDIGDQLFVWLSDVGVEGDGRGRPASAKSRYFARMVDQLTTMGKLLDISIGQWQDDCDSSTAWVVLELARQQFGYAALTAGLMTNSTSASDLSDHSDPLEVSDVPDFHDARAVSAAATGLSILMQRDLLPEPAHAGQVVDFGNGDGSLPDFRPETPLNLGSLQLLANTVMQWGTVIAGPMPPFRIEKMAYGTYLAMIIEESMELLHEHATVAEQPVLVREANHGLDAAGLLHATTQKPWEVFLTGENGADAA